MFFLLRMAFWLCVVCVLLPSGTKLNEKSAPDEQAAAKDTSASGQGTLTASDIQPSWHAPVPLPPRREARASRPAA